MLDPIQGALGILVSFGLIILLVLRRVDYGFALALGAVILGTFFGLNFEGLLGVAYHTITDRSTLELSLVIALIPILAKALEDTKLMEEFIKGLKDALSPRMVLAAVPAVFGLLPMMGGALLSAPLIDEEADDLRVDAEKKSVINIWFRHLWFYVSPLSPMLIITAGLTGLGLYDLILVNIPVFFFHLIIGYLLIIKPIKNVVERSSVSSSKRTLLKSSSPVVLTILSNILGVPLALSITLGIVLAFLLGRFNLQSMVHTIRVGFQWRLVAAILGVMYFRYIIKFAGVESFIISHAMNMGISPIIFLTGIPLLFGIITASPSASVVMSIPLAASVFTKLSPASTSLLHNSIVVSYNVSPLHLCLVLTVGYYKPQLNVVYRWLVPLYILDYIVALITGFTLMGLFY